MQCDHRSKSWPLHNVVIVLRKTLSMWQTIGCSVNEARVLGSASGGPAAPPVYPPKLPLDVWPLQGNLQLRVQHVLASLHCTCTACSAAAGPGMDPGRAVPHALGHIAPQQAVQPSVPRRPVRVAVRVVTIPTTLLTDVAQSLIAFTAGLPSYIMLSRLFLLLYVVHCSLLQLKLPLSLVVVSTFPGCDRLPSFTTVAFMDKTVFKLVSTVNLPTNQPTNKPTN